MIISICLILPYVWMKIHFCINFLGITEKFITTLFYFYRRISKPDTTNTEYALIAATIVFSGKKFFSCENHSVVKICTKFGNEMMRFVVTKLLITAKCTNFVLSQFPSLQEHSFKLIYTL